MSELERRQKMMSELLSSVQHCQVRYGGKSELATENEEVVSKLCRSLESVFSHGLKSRPNPGSALKQMTDLVSSNLGGFLTSSVPSSSSAKPVMWNFVKVYLNRHELERYMLLKSVNSDAGRGRAWLRAALNEHSLERYVHLFLADSEVLEQHYEPTAFIRDEERSAMLPSMAAGLGSILFAIMIDNAILNDCTDPFAKTQHEESLILAILSHKATSVESKTTVTTSSDSACKKKKAKNRKASVKIVDFDDEDNETTTEHNDVSVASEESSQSHRRLPSYAASLPGALKVDKHKMSPTPSLSYEPIHLSDSRQKLSSLNKASKIESHDDDTDLDIYSRSSIEVDENEGERYMSANSSLNIATSVSTLTPIRNIEIGGLIPFTANGEQRNDIQSEDSASVHSYGEESDYGSVFTDLPPTPGKQDHISSGRSVTGASRASSVGSAISREDLKQALLSVMSRKDELQSQCIALKKLLEQESLMAAGLQDEVKEARRKCTESNDKLGIRIQTLTRENELLKHQLKKYVGAVQKLRDGPMAYETLAQLEGQSAAANAEASMKYVDYHYEASEFEKKLIQVAEMHGELLEFNEHLQKTIQSKDVYIKRLRDELVELRGPLPNGEGDQQEDSISVVSEAESMATSIMSITSQNKFSLINIWIPSVFLSGTGSRTHHVYQVYLKIGSEEWNIYRRYSEFYALHKDLQQRERAVATFDFPPKKTVGYKADKVVEDRRKRLQAYLRCVVNLMVQMNPSLLAKPDKEHVVLLMPFFAETSTRLGHSTTSPSSISSHGHRLFQRNNTTRSEPTPQLAL